MPTSKCDGKCDGQAQGMWPWLVCCTLYCTVCTVYNTTLAISQTEVDTCCAHTVPTEGPSSLEPRPGPLYPTLALSQAEVGTCCAHTVPPGDLQKGTKPEKLQPGRLGHGFPEMNGLPREKRMDGYSEKS